MEEPPELTFTHVPVPSMISINWLAQVIVPLTDNASVDPSLFSSIRILIVSPGSKTLPPIDPTISIPTALNSFPDEKRFSAPLPK